MITLMKKCTQLSPIKHVSKLFFDLATVISVVTILLFSGGKLQAQVSFYSFSQSLVGYTPLSAPPTTAITAPFDNTVSTTAFIPFTFLFNGAPYTGCRISANGFITFGATFPAGTVISPLSNVTAYQGAISALGTDLVSNGSNVVYGTEGVAPNRIFVVQWTNVQRFQGSLIPGDYNFQIRLHETTQVIECSYGPCSSTSNIPVGTQVGLRGVNNAFPLNINNRSMAADLVWFNNTNPGTAFNSFIRTVNLAYPDLGLSFKWTPPPTCVTPTAQPTALVLGNTGITDTAINGNSFTAASPAPTSYLVLRSTTSVPPTSVQVPNGTFPVVGGIMGASYTVVSNSASTTFTQTGLAPDTTYYYWIISYNSICLGAPFYNLTNILTGNATTCSSPTNALAATNILGNGMDANWTSVPGATDYRIDVATTNAFGATTLPAYNNLSVGNVTTFSITGLNPVTQYHYRIRAIGASCTVNSNIIGPVSTTCGFYTIPYFQNFDTTAPNTIPTCYTREDANADAIQWSVQGTTYASSPRSMHINKNAALAMDDWFFLPGLNLTGGISYRLQFKYNTASTASTTENLRAMLGSLAASGSMTQTLLDLSNINNTLFKSTYVDFTPVISGVYYIGFTGYSAANQTYIAVDDVSVTLSPTCFEPTDVTATLIMSSTATVSWTPPVPEPVNGYQYFLSTSATPPTAATVPTGTVGFGINTVNLTLLSSSTAYYIWVRGNCGATDKSIWSLEETFTTECNTPVISSNTPATRCGVGTATLSAIPNAGSVINWYAAATGGSILYTGNNFTTPILSATTTYYAEAKASGAIAKVGPATPVNQTGAIVVQNFQSSVNFTVTDDTSLQSIDIFPIASFQVGQLVLRTSSNITIATFTFTTTVSGGSTLQTIPLAFALTPGDYNLFLGILPPSGLSMNSTNAFYPYTSSVANITGNPIDNTQYLGFYNWKFTTQCLSGRIPVAVTVSPPPALGISAATSVICENTSTPAITLTGASAYNTFTWLPNTGVSGNATIGYTFNPTTTTTYTLTASQTSGGFCSNVITHTVTVNPIPPPVTIVPAATITLCQNSVQAMNGSVGTFSSVPILTQNFNDATNDWTTANTSIDGDTAASEWTLRPDNYHYISSAWNVTFDSNDSSQFYFANSDSQGSSLMTTVVTKTTLTSPSFSLLGFTSATLNFYHYIRHIGGDTFNVEVSVNGGSWIVVKQYSATQGTSTAFSSANVDISAYVTNTDVRLRFNYVSNWGYGWAIDNIDLKGTVATALTWSPNTDLYTDAAATVPYILGTPMTTVYAKPMTTTVYSATATGANGCLSTGNITINIDPLPNGGVLGSNQILCGGSIPANFVLTGHSGTIVRWERADDAAFTLNVVPIANITPTLTSALMGVISTIKYFRAVVSNGVCALTYSSVGSVTFPSTTWNGTVWSAGAPTSSTKAIFNGAYTSSGDLYACAVQVLSGAVTFTAGTNLVVNNEVTVTSGTLTFNNTASLVQYNASVNSGNIIYKRDTTPMRKFDYTYWSSPVAAQNLTAFSPNTNPGKFYSWNPAINNWAFASGNMVPAKGYIIRAPDIAPFDLITPQIFNAAFTGVPNNGTLTTAMVKNALGDLNLIGNPYPSAIDADLLLSDADNLTTLDATIYLWTHNSPINANVYTQNDYAVYNLMGGVGTKAATNGGVNISIPNGNIAAGEGFFIHALQSGSATFKNSMRLLSNNDQFFRNQQSLNDKHRLWLDVSNDQGAYKQTLIGYAEEATYGKDRGFDGTFVDGGNVVGLYSLIGNEKYSIQGRPMPFDDQDQVPLGFSSTIGGAFTIKLSQFDGLFADQNVYLEDKQFSIIHNLKETNYVFTAAPGVLEDRFVLRYNPSALSNPDFDIHDLVIFKENMDWTINSGTTDMESVSIFDVRGRLLLTKKAIQAHIFSFNVGATNEVLLVQITSVDGMRVTKKVVN
jgi:hypothetical protein